MKVFNIHRSLAELYFFSSIIWLLCISFCHAQQDASVLHIKHSPKTNTLKSPNPLYGEFYELSDTFSWSPSYIKDDSPSFTVQLENAAAVVLFLEGLDLSNSAHLEITDGIGKSYFFDSRHISQKGILNTGVLPGKSIQITLHGHGQSDARKSDIALKKMVLLNAADYDLITPANSTKDFGASDNCNIDVNCAQGANIQNEKRGVARILLVVEEGMGWCSGSLINNSAQNYQALFLTAFHCQDGFTPLFDLWRFDFNYEHDNCSGGLDEPLRDAMTGCTFRVGRQSSDFMLLEIQASVPYSYQPYWNGWNRSDQAASNLIMPHHPKGDIKKVTRFDDDLSIRSFPRNLNWTNNVITPANHHWEAPHTSGMFEVGSSGAPALDPQGRIVGQLHGGVINCNSGVSYFGKLNRSWVDVQSDGQGLFRELSPAAPDRMSIAGLDAPDSYCLGTSIVNQSNGTISDGSQSDVYLPGTNCSFLIRLPDNEKQVLLQIQQLDLGSGDSLFLYDGANVSTSLLDVWTGGTSTVAQVLANGHEMFIVFKADDIAERQGFELLYSSEDIGLDLQVSLDSKDSERTVVYLYDEQFFLLDSAEYRPASPTSFESVFEIEENSGRYFLSARIYNPDWREGVSSLDLLRMEMIFRQDQPFNNLYEFLSADIDNDFEVNLSDLIGIARFVRRLDDRWWGRTYIQLYDPEALEACENANWIDCMRYTPVEYIEINSGNQDPTGPLQIRFERLQEGDLNRSARF